MLQSITRIALPALFLASAASAQQFESWTTTTDGWNVFLNNKTGGCFAEYEDAAGNVLQIGTEAGLFFGGESTQFGFLAIYIPGSGSDGAVGPVTVDLGPETYEAAAHTVSRDGYVGGYIVGKDQQFEKSLGDRREMVVTGPNYKTTVNLLNLGTAEAMEVVKTCQRRKGG